MKRIIVNLVAILICLQPVFSQDIGEQAVKRFENGMTNLKNGQFEQAVEDFSAAIEQETSFKEAYMNRGICYSMTKQYREAVDDFSRVIHLEPKNPKAYNYRGFTRSELGKDEKDPELIKEGLSDINKAIQMDPSFKDAYLNRGVLYIWLGEYAKAIVDYNKVIELYPEEAKAYYDRGIAKEELNNFEDACADWNKAKSLGFSLADRTLALYCKGR